MWPVHSSAPCVAGVVNSALGVLAPHLVCCRLQQAGAWAVHVLHVAWRPSPEDKSVLLGLARSARIDRCSDAVSGCAECPDGRALPVQAGRYATHRLRVMRTCMWVSGALQAATMLDNKQRSAHMVYEHLQTRMVYAFMYACHIFRMAIVYGSVHGRASHVGTYMHVLFPAAVLGQTQQ